MRNYEQDIIKDATGTAAKLRELSKTGKITLDSAPAIGEAIALLEILSRSLASHHEPAL